MNTAPDSLDAAWAEAEAALPEGWTLDALRRGGNGVWHAYADSNQHLGGPYRGRPFADEAGATHVAALRALAYRLRARVPS